MRLRGWLGLVVVGLLGAGCGDNAQATVDPTACVPSCRAGYVCASGACVSACNPPCANGQTCVGSGASAVCIGTDAGNAVDVVTTSDAGNAVDVVTTDATTATDAAGCGQVGEACCDLRYCAMGAECDATLSGGVVVSANCRVAPPGVAECARPSDCTGAGQVCGGPVLSGAHLCFQCGAATGTLPLLAACTGSAMCASGLCSLRQCSTPCATDAECNALAPGAVCTAVRYTNAISATESVFVTRTVCVRGCTRNADCTNGQICHPALNRVTDHVDFICEDAPAMTSPAGVACTSGETCQSSLCPQAHTAGQPSVCTAPCGVDADCPAAAPHCLDYSVARPSGAAQTARGCFAS